MRLFDEIQKSYGVVLLFVHCQESQKGIGRITLTVKQHGVLAEEYKAKGFRWTDELREKSEKQIGPEAEAV